MRMTDPHNIKDWAALVGNMVHLLSHVRTNAGRVASGLREQKKANAALEAEIADLRSRLEETLTHVSQTAALCDNYEVPDISTLVEQLEAEIDRLHEEARLSSEDHQDTMKDCHRLLKSHEVVDEEVKFWRRKAERNAEKKKFWRRKAESRAEEIEVNKAADILSGISQARVSKPSSSSSSSLRAPPPPPKISASRSPRSRNGTPRWVRELLTERKDTEVTDFSGSRRG